MGKKSREKRERREREKMEGKPLKIQPEGGFSLICLNAIRWGTYLALFAPLIVSAKFFFPFVGPKSLYFMGLAEIIFAAWLLLIIYSPQYRPRLNILTAALIIFVAILILSTVFGTDPSRSFWSKPERMTGLLMWFHLFAFFLVISSVFKKSEDWTKIFSVSIFAAILVSLVSLFPEAGILASSREGATIGNSSFMGVYLLFNIFLAIWLLIKSSLPLKIYSAISLSIIVPALLLSGARAAILSFLGGLFLLFFLYLIFVPKRRYLNLLGKFLLAGSLVVFLVIVFFIFQPDNAIQQKFIEKATKARLVVWEKAWNGFQERPWLGWGPENFDFVFTKYFNPCMFLSECGGEIWFDRAHNIVLDTLVATGIIGFLAYLGIFAAAFYVLWRKYFSNYINFWTAGIFSVILISYFVQNLTVFDMINSYLMFLLVLGMIGSFSSCVSLGEKLKPKFLWLIVILILIPFCLSFSKFVIKPLQTDYYVIAALREQPGSEEKLTLYKKTLATSPLGRYQIRDFFAQDTLSSMQSKTAKEIPAENFKREFDFVSSELEKSAKEAPLEFRTFLKLGQVYNVYAQIDSKKLARAEEILKKAIEVSPTNQQGYWTLAQTKLYQGRFKEALSLAEKALSLEPKLLQSHLIVIQIAKIMGDKDLVQRKAQEAIEINPDWEADIKKILES